MKRWIIIAGLLGLISLFSCAQKPRTPPPQPAEPKIQEKVDYYIVPDDVLQIFVQDQAKLSRDYIVRPDGKISMYMIGDLSAVGLTLTQLDEAITTSLNKYIRTPDVCVAVKKFGGEKIFILGAVSKPGMHKFVGNIRLIEAIAMAGGHTGAAKLKTVLVVRGDITKKPKVLVVNVKKIITKGDLKSNIVMRPKDIVYLPTSFISDFSAFIRSTLAPTLSTIVTLDYFRTRWR